MKKMYLNSWIKNIGVYLSLFSFIPVIGLEAMYDTEIFALLRILCCLSALFHYIRRRKFSGLMSFIIAFEMWLIGVTIFYRGSNLIMLYGSMVIISTCVFFEYQIGKNGVKFLLKLYRYCRITIFLNLLSILLVPEGLYFGDFNEVRCYYLLGNYNLFIVHILPAVCVGYHLMVSRRIKKRNYFFLWTMVVATYLLRTSVTSVIGLLIFGMFLLFFNKRVWKAVFNPIIYVISAMTIGYLLVFVHSGNLISYISSVTGKSITFSGRTIIWSNMIERLSSHWVIGYGIQNVSEFIKAVGHYHAHHAHNLILQVMWQGGYIGACLLGGILLIAVYSLLKVSNNKIARSYGCTLFVLLVMSITEFYQYKVIFSMIVILNTCCIHIRSWNEQIGNTILGGVI